MLIKKYGFFNRLNGYTLMAHFKQNKRDGSIYLLLIATLSYFKSTPIHPKKC